MAIVTTSGRIVKGKVSGVRPVVKACRAKALTPWAGWVYSPPDVDADMAHAPASLTLRSRQQDGDAEPRPEAVMTFGCVPR